MHFQGGKLKYELDGLRWKSSISDDGTGEGPPTGEGERLTPEGGGVTINARDKGEGVMRPVRALACAVDEHWTINYSLRQSTMAGQSQRQMQHIVVCVINKLIMYAMHHSVS